MRTTIEVSRTSVQMAITSISGVWPAAKRPLMVTLIEKKLTDFLSSCPDHFFKLTIESSNASSEGK